MTAHGTPAQPAPGRDPIRAGELTNGLRPTPQVDALVERVAHRVVELLQEGGHTPMLDASQVAQRFGRTRDWVYRHADDLGAVPLGSGTRPRLVFDPAKVADYLSACSAGRRTEGPSKPVAAPIAQRRRQRINGQGDDLLPIRGDAPCP